VGNRVAIILGVGVVVVLGIAGAIYLMRPPEEVAPASVAVAPKPTAAPVDAPKPAATPAAPKPTAAAAPTPTPEAAPTMGTLVFESDVPDTSVFIDRVFIGTIPVTAQDVKPGTHALKLSAAGYDGFAETIEVTPGTKTLSYKFKEVRLDATLAVVHKHAVGSCTGTLRATPKGLTYDTTNKDDGFTVALPDLETFAVDYIAKNLRVKLKKGKSFNFTDPDGKADRLQLFFDEVDKARQRIIGGK
jgi:hypothetical protein